MLKTLNVEIEILKVLKNMLILSPEKWKFMSPPPPVTEFLHYTGNELALTQVKHILFCIPDDAMHQLMALPPSQLRDTYHLSPLAAGQLSPSHSTSGKIESVQTTHRKGFTAKREVSPQPLQTFSPTSLTVGSLRYTLSIQIANP